MEEHAWCSNFSVEALANFIEGLGGRAFVDAAKAVREEGIAGEDLVPHLGNHLILTQFLLQDCKIDLLPFAAIKLHYKLTRPFAGSLTGPLLVKLVKSCGGTSMLYMCAALRPHLPFEHASNGDLVGTGNEKLAELLETHGVTGADISGNLSNVDDLVAFCSTFNVQLVRLVNHNALKWYGLDLTSLSWMTRTCPYSNRLHFAPKSCTIDWPAHPQPRLVVLRLPRIPMLQLVTFVCYLWFRNTSFDIAREFLVRGGADTRMLVRMQAEARRRCRQSRSKSRRGRSCKTFESRIPSQLQKWSCM